MCLHFRLPPPVESVVWCVACCQAGRIPAYSRSSTGETKVPHYYQRFQCILADSLARHNTSAAAMRGVLCPRPFCIDSTFCCWQRRKEPGQLSLVPQMKQSRVFCLHGSVPVCSGRHPSHSHPSDVFPLGLHG